MVTIMDPYNTLDTIKFAPGSPKVGASDLHSDYDAHRALVETCLKHEVLSGAKVIAILDHLEEPK